MEGATSAAEESEAAPSKRARVACARCDTSNEPDAAFCKKCAARLARGSHCPVVRDVERAGCHVLQEVRRVARQRAGHRGEECVT